MHKSKPIKNQNEYHEVMSKVTKEAVRVLKISGHQARLRIEALFDSGVLDEFAKDEKLFEFVTDIAMRIPQRETEKEVGL